VKAKILNSFLWGAVLLTLSVSLYAHHGTFVSYDTAHPVTMKGVITEFHYTNPHIQLYFDVKDASGKVTHWSAEGPDPAVLVQAGWGRKRTEGALAPGTEVTITVSPARNGKPVGTVSNVVFADGNSLCGLGGARGKGNCPQQ
jgi:Family of unknown function (DUF6152)